MSIITLLTDFGTRDYYVGAVKGVLSRLAPGATLVDISHQVAPGDVAEAAFVLAAAAPEFPPATVHLAVVDPGVGSERRVLAARAGAGLFVAPDNGLLTHFLGGAESREVTARRLFRDAPGDTFHGRDRFAPVAAYLARGEEFSLLGPLAAKPVRLAAPAPSRGPDRLEGRVVHVDRFGNLVTDIPSEWVDREVVSARLGGHRAHRLVSHYAELAEGEAGVVPGSLGTLELSVPNASLAERWGASRGDPVRVELRDPNGAKPR